MLLTCLVDPHFRSMREVFSAEDLKRLQACARVVWGEDTPAADSLIEAEREKVEAVICARWRYGAVTRFPRLRAILEVSGRFPDLDSLDYPACFARSIRVLSCAPAFAPLVAEMALALALASARGVVEGDACMRAGSERFYQQDETGFSLFEQPAGLIGYGSIARALQPLLAPFRCPIRVTDPWMTPAYLRSQGVQPATVEEVLSESRVVFVLASPSGENKAMLNRERLSLMPPRALLVLVSRAHVVDWEALTELLRAGRIHAAIDVFPTEPPPKDDPVRSLPGVSLSPHRAGGAGVGHTFIGRMVVDDLEAIAAGLPPRRMQQAEPELIRLRGSVRV